jgi:nitrogen fixation protein
MRVKIYGVVVVKPVKFPKELNVFLFPLRSSDGSSVNDPTWKVTERRSWEWVQGEYFPHEELEARLKGGKEITVAIGWKTVQLPDDTKFPEGCEYEILEGAGVA